MDKFEDGSHRCYLKEPGSNKAKKQREVKGNESREREKEAESGEEEKHDIT